jgi:phospholipid-binding lipoprotein MlaA
VAPVSEVYGALTPRFVQQGVHNGLRNLDEPRNFFNFVFQGNGLKARNSLARFLVNSTIGLAGLIDVAGRAGIEYEPTDFGMTLARAGVPEGPYLVVPGLGPTTRRDSWASFVDLAFSPPFWVGMTVEGTASDVLTISTITGFALDTRYRNADLIDSVIYASPDSYTTEQSIYLQRRRARIRGEMADTGDEFLPVIP